MKPIAWRHMAFWGAIIGFIAGGAFMLAVIMLNLVPSNVVSAGFFAVLTSAHVGAVLGILLGIIDGFLVEFSLPIATSKFDKEQYQRQIWITLPLIIIATALISKPLIDTTITMIYDFLYAGADPLFNTSWITLIPAGIASLVAGYVANRYLLRLRKYSEPARKSHDIARKIKRQERPERVVLDDYLVNEIKQQRGNRSE